MKKILKLIFRTFKFLGFNPITLINNFRGIPFYIHDFYKIRKQKGKDSKFYFGQNFPVLHERFSESGTMTGAYFHQDLLVAKRIFKNNPTKHIDIGSRTDGFVAHVASFREIEIFDIRQQKSKIDNIGFRQADLMNLPSDLIDYCDSISSLHAIEHFGLGRYGDPIDYLGHEKAIYNIAKILNPGGKFYFSVPIGKQRIEFNAHRVFDVSYLIQLLKTNFIVERFSYVDDKGDMHENVDLLPEEIKSNFRCFHGCGIFELIKR